MKKYIYIIAVTFLFSGQSIAQEKDLSVDVNVDDLGNVSDEFQEYFFEALKQRAIENYDKAIIALQKCKSIKPLPVIFFEIGKNQNSLGHFDEAVKNLSMAHNEEPQNRDIIAELYNSYYLKKDYENAIVAVRKLIKYNPDYSEDLANLYFLTGKYDEALAVLDELDQKLGNSEYRDSLRRRIYAQSSNKASQISILKKRIIENPDQEKNYLNLIFVYSENGEEDKAFETAEILKEKMPDSDLAHLALYKFYLDKQRTTAAINSMRAVLESNEIDVETKYKVLNDFLIFVNNNPSYQSQMEQIVEVLAQNEGNALVYEKLGEYYLNKDYPERALSFFKKGLNEEPDNYNLLKHSSLLYIDNSQFLEAEIISASALDFYPSQPLFYLLNGVAQNGLKNYAEAEESLLYGLDYLIDDVQMEADFMEQLSITYKGLNNLGKSEEYQKKALALNKKTDQ